MAGLDCNVSDGVTAVALTEPW